MNLEERLEELLAEVRSLRLGSTPRLPTVLSYKLAAHELSVSVSTVKKMVRSGYLATCEVAGKTGHRGIPAKEILRIASAATTPRVRPRRQVQRYDAKAEAQAIRDAIRAERKKRS